MTQEELKILLQSDESYRIERTASTSNMDKFQEAICAFSNDLAGSGKKGYLLIGVNDDGSISGLKVDDALQKKIASIRSDGNILPLPVMTVEKVEMPDGDVLVVEVTPSASTPIRYRGRTFVRIGPRRDIASLEEERILSERCTAMLATFDVLPCREASINDIDTDAVRDYLTKAIDYETLKIDSRSLKEQMASLRLFNMRYDCPTMAAIILFGTRVKYFMPGAYIQYVHFAGTDNGSDIINEKSFEGPLVKLLPRLDSFIEDGIVTNRPVPISVLRERTATNYPFEALRELIMNACMHRDYQSNTPIRLYQYSDRIEIMNTGGLYGDARPENFPHVNAYRNPVVAEALKVLKYVNMFNRGISRVQTLLKKNDSLPARFLVDKITVFEAIITDANVANCSPSIEELIHELSEELSEIVKSLIINIKDAEKSRLELQLSENCPEISKQQFLLGYIQPAIALGLVELTYPDKPNHPKQKYRLTDLGKAVLQSIKPETH